MATGAWLEALRNAIDTVVATPKDIAILVTRYVRTSTTDAGTGNASTYGETKKKSAAPGCRLLELPPELRNQIWENVLIEWDSDVMDLIEDGEFNGREPIQPWEGLEQPGLTRTCRQIRDETIKIWYLRNWFAMDVESCDSSMLVAFTKHIAPYQQDNRKVEFTPFPVGGCDWARLVAWCKSVWAAEVETFGNSLDPEDQYEKTIDAALSIAKTCRGVDWTSCEKALEAYRAVAGIIDEDWLKD